MGEYNLEENPSEEEIEIFNEFKIRCKNLSDWVYKNLPYGQIIPEDGVDVCLLLRATEKDEGTLYSARYTSYPWIDNDYAFSQIANYIIRQISIEDMERIKSTRSLTGS